MPILRRLLVAGWLALLSVSTANAAPIAEVHACPPGTPPRERALAGFITVRVSCDRVLLEVPDAVLGRDLLATTEFAGMSAGSDDVSPGEVLSSAVIRWRKRGARLILERVRYDMWADRAPAVQRTLQAAPLGTVIRMFDPAMPSPPGTTIIDITSMFSTDVPDGFGQLHRARFGVTGIDPRRSYIARVKAGARNIGFRFYQTWVPDPKKRLENPATARELGFLFNTSILMLPDKPMRPRYWDDRVGYFPVSFVDYGSGQHGGQRRAYIQRYRLEKRDPALAVSEPREPIVFYLSREVPVKWRPYLVRAVEDWNPLFEAAGFRNALVARNAPSEDEDPGWDPEDLPRNVIRWTPGSRQNALGPATVDPRSGEVISSHTIFWHDILELIEAWYFTQAGPLDPRAAKLPLPDDLMGELLRYVASHEIGHALGLRHNFKAHTAYTVKQLRDPAWTLQWGTSASLMSYARFNYVAQPGDGAGLMPRFGPYDYFAVRWGYEEFPGTPTTDDEWPRLDEMAAQQITDPMLRFGGEDAAADYDPAVDTQVLGSDPLEATALGLRNIGRAAAMLVPATTSLGGDFSRMRDMYDALVQRRDSELRAVARLVGGVDEIRYQGGRGEAPFTPVHPDRQRAAVAFLIEHAFQPPAALLNPEILRRLTPTRGADPLQGSNINILSQMLRLGVFTRMAESREFWPQARRYEGYDLLRHLNDGLFRELGDASPRIGHYRRTLQRNYLLRLRVVSGSSPDPIDQPTPNADTNAARGVCSDRDLPAETSVMAYSSPLADTARSYYTSPLAASEFRAALRAGLEHLRAKIRSRLPSVRDAVTRVHLKDLLAQLDHTL